MAERFYAYQWGDGPDKWSVCETPGGGWQGEPISVLSWLTERQARAIAEALNNMAGDKWYEKHPDWFAEMKEQGAAKRR